MIPVSRTLAAAAILILASCSEGEPEFRSAKVRRAVEIAGVGYEPAAGCVLVGPISMPGQDLTSLGTATGGAEVDFFHELMGTALRMGANLVAPAAGVEAARAAASGEAFQGHAYRCPR